MRTLAAVCLTALLFGTSLEAEAAGPDLTVGLTCGQSMVGSGVTVTVPIEFRAGSADGGQPNAVSAIDMVVAFAPDAFTVEDVRLPDTLAGSGDWALDWERTLGLPETPGRVGIALAPAFRFPVPSLPDGVIAEVQLIAAATVGEGRCVPIEIVTDSVVLSSPPLGLPVAPGTLTNGGVAITGLCGNCDDDDGDGFADLADPDCGALEISFARKTEKVTVVREKSGDVVVNIRGSLPTVVDDVTNLEIEVRPDGVDPPACAAMELPLKEHKGRKKKTFIFALPKKQKVKLVSDAKTQRTKLRAKLSGFDIPVDTTSLSFSLWLGSDGFFASLPAGNELIFK